MTTGLVEKSADAPVAQLWHSMTRNFTSFVDPTAFSAVWPEARDLQWVITTLAVLAVAVVLKQLVPATEKAKKGAEKTLVSSTVAAGISKPPTDESQTGLGLETETECDPAVAPVMTDSPLGNTPEVVITEYPDPLTPANHTPNQSISSGKESIEAAVPSIDMTPKKATGMAKPPALGRTLSRKSSWKDHPMYQDYSPSRV